MSDRKNDQIAWCQENVDFERASMLIALVNDIAGVHPQLMSLSSAASAELKQMNDAIADYTKAEAKRLAEEASIARATELRAADKSSVEATNKAERDHEVDLSGDGLIGGGVGGNTEDDDYDPATVNPDVALANDPNPTPRRI